MSKSFVDLTNLSRYNTKIKEYIAGEIEKFSSHYVKNSELPTINGQKTFVLEGKEPGLYFFDGRPSVQLTADRTPTTGQNVDVESPMLFLIDKVENVADGQAIALIFPYVITSSNSVVYTTSPASLIKFANMPSTMAGLVKNKPYASAPYVAPTGNQTITGIKTFNTLPQSSVVPSDDKDLTNKKYVDDSIATKQGILTAGDNISIVNNVISAAGGNVPVYPIELTSSTYYLYSNENYQGDGIYVITNPLSIYAYVSIASGETINMSPYSTVIIFAETIKGSNNTRYYTVWQKHATNKTAWPVVYAVNSNTWQLIKKSIGAMTYTSNYGETSSAVLPIGNTNEFTPTGDYNPATKKYVDDAVATKQNTLTAGDNITIENDVISASGGGSDIPVYYIETDKTYRMYDDDKDTGVYVIKNTSQSAINVFCGSSSSYAKSISAGKEGIIFVEDYSADKKRLFFFKGDELKNVTISPSGGGIYNGTSYVIPALLNSDRASSNSVLSIENKVAYTPTSNYHPATKKYVDDAVAGITIPTASDSTLGGIKVGNNLSIDENGVLSASGGIPNIHYVEIGNDSNSYELYNKETGLYVIKNNRNNLGYVRITSDYSESAAITAQQSKIFFVETDSSLGNKKITCTSQKEPFIIGYQLNSNYELTTKYKSEVTTNKVTSLSSSSTDTEYPSAKCVYDAIAAAGGKTYTGGKYINIDSNDVVDLRDTQAISSSSSNDVGRTNATALDLTTLGVGKYYYSNYSSASMSFYYKYINASDVLTTTSYTTFTSWNYLEIEILEDMSKSISEYASNTMLFKCTFGYSSGETLVTYFYKTSSGISNKKVISMASASQLSNLSSEVSTIQSSVQSIDARVTALEEGTASGTQFGQAYTNSGFIVGPSPNNFYFQDSNQEYSFNTINIVGQITCDPSPSAMTMTATLSTDTILSKSFTNLALKIVDQNNKTFTFKFDELASSGTATKTISVSAMPENGTCIGTLFYDYIEEQEESIYINISDFIAESQMSPGTYEINIQDFVTTIGNKKFAIIKNDLETLIEIATYEGNYYLEANSILYFNYGYYNMTEQYVLEDKTDLGSIQKIYFNTTENIPHYIRYILSTN